MQIRTWSSLNRLCRRLATSPTKTRMSFQKASIRHIFSYSTSVNKEPLSDMKEIDFNVNSVQTYCQLGLDRWILLFVPSRFGHVFGFCQALAELNAYGSEFAAQVKCSRGPFYLFGSTLLLISISFDTSLFGMTRTIRGHQHYAAMYHVLFQHRHNVPQRATTHSILRCVSSFMMDNPVRLVLFWLIQSHRSHRHCPRWSAKYGSGTQAKLGSVNWWEWIEWKRKNDSDAKEAFADHLRYFWIGHPQPGRPERIWFESI